MTSKRPSDQALVEELAADPEFMAPAPAADWERLGRLLERLDHAKPDERGELFAQADDSAGKNEAAQSLVARKRRILGVDGAA